MLENILTILLICWLIYAFYVLWRWSRVSKQMDEMLDQLKQELEGDLE